MKKQNNKAFTLVELMVVITILAGLATVAFISFQWYTSSSRDSVRLADLKNISKSFEINRTKWIDFPLPDKKVDISASGTIFQYQWELSQNILEKNLNIFDGGLDPVTKKPYGYAVNFARNKFQIIWFLENSQTAGNNLFSESLADNTDKYVKTSGDTLGILLDETTNEVIVQSGSLVEIDIQSNTQNYWVIVDKLKKWDSDFVSWELAFRVNFLQSCNAILKSWNSKWDDIYTINPTWVNWEQFDVYCDMTTDWWGWTLLLTSDSESTAFWNNYKSVNEWYSSGSLGILPLNSTQVYDEIDFKSLAYSNLSGNSVRLCLWDSQHCYEFEHNKNISLFDFFDKNISYHDAWYNNHVSFLNKYNVDRISQFENQLWWYEVYKYRCGWLGINKIRPWIDNRNNGSIGLLIDNDGGCIYDKEAVLGHFDNWAMWVGLNSCGDNSYPEDWTTCQSGWYVSKAGIQRWITDPWYNTILWPWVVWQK